MQRGVVLLFVVSVLAQPVVAVHADNVPQSELQQVQQRLAAASTAITDLNNRIVGLDRSIAGTQGRIGQERSQLAQLARTIYVEPNSLLVVLAESPSLGDALTRFSDLAVAAERATATERALEGDLVSLSKQRSDMAADLRRQQDLQSQLEGEYAQLTQIASPGAPLPAPSPPPAPGATGNVQQIILDAFAPLGPGAQAWAMRISRCESGYNRFAVNRSSGASGLFQFLPSTWAHSPFASRSPFDPAANAQAAAWLYKRSGPAAWQCK
jgi:hypothetical protein